MNLGGLKRFLDTPPPPRAVRVEAERCEMCATPIGEEHSHVVNIESRRLMCTCRPCTILFTESGAAQGKLRAVPDRFRRATGMSLDEAGWGRLQIPVRTAFFFKNSVQARHVAFYPSPAGATESLLGLDELEELAAAHPDFKMLEPDVEALLVHGPKNTPFQAYLVPINSCYELVGRVRKGWRGFDGGEAAWKSIDEFFAGIAARCQTW